MAWVNELQIERNQGIGRLQPTQVTARVKIYDPIDADGSPIVQIDTFGSNDRQNPGKQSQTIQLGREVASQLVELLKDVYDL